MRDATSHRSTQPFGAAGGQSAKTGHNYVERANGAVDELNATDQTDMKPGDIFVIETPGGGGYGTS